MPETLLSDEALRALNARLEPAHPREIVRWAIDAGCPPAIYGDGWEGRVPPAGSTWRRGRLVLNTKSLSEARS